MRQIHRLSGMTKIGFAISLSALALLGSSIGYSQDAAPSPEQTITVAVPNMPPFSNPYRSLGGPEYHLSYMVFDTPTFINSSGELTYRAVESIENVNETTWLLHVRQGVLFHDGTEMTADDVAFSLTYALDPDNAYAVRARSGPIAASVVDRYTVQAETEEPDPLFERRLTLFPIVPRAQLEEMGTEGFMAHPIGSGPFRLAEYSADQRVVLDRFEEYWGETARAARVILLHMPDPSTRLAALQRGDVDVAQGILHDQIATLEQSSSLRVEAAPVSMTVVFDLNTIGGHPALKDKRIRQAINYAVDKEAILDGIFLGYGAVLDGQMVTPDTFGYNPAVEAYPYDPERSRQLIEEAGYAPGEITLEISYAQGFFPPGTSDVPVAVAAYLSDVGINAELNPLEYSRYIEFFYGEVEGDLFGWPPRSQAGDAEFVYPFVTCESAKPIWCDESFDAVFDASRSMVDREQRLELLHEAAAILREEAPLLFLLQPSVLYGVSNEVQEFLVSPHDFILLDKLSKE